MSGFFSCLQKAIYTHFPRKETSCTSFGDDMVCVMQEAKELFTRICREQLLFVYPQVISRLADIMTDCQWYTQSIHSLSLHSLSGCLGIFSSISFTNHMQTHTHTLICKSIVYFRELPCSCCTLFLQACAFGRRLFSVVSLRIVYMCVLMQKCS